MAKVTKNLNHIISGSMHGPLSADGFVLYPKVKGYSGVEEGNATKAEQSPKYIQQSAVNFNSPTNIRKLFITHKGVYTQYFGVPKTLKNTGRHFVERTYKNENVSLTEVAKKILTYGDDLNKYNMSKSIGQKVEEPTRYNVMGNTIGVVSSPYTCNNIEEIYIDWTLFLSAEVQPYFPNYSNGNAIISFLNKNVQYSMVVSDELLNFFSLNNSSGVKDLRKRFPRLRVIAMISNLEDIMKHPSMKKTDERFTEIAPKTWIKDNEQLIAASNSLVLYKQLADIKPDNENFVIKDNQYKYDNEVLKGLIEAHNKKRQDELRKMMYGTDGTNSSEDNEDDNVAEMSEVEKYLVNIEKQYGETAVKKILACATLGMPVSELKQTFVEFTKPNRKRMAKMIGFNIQ